MSVVVSAVVNVITSRVISKAIKKCNKQEAIDEKLQKLEMLCLKIHGIVEASEKHLITNNYLLKWQDKLKKAVTDGDEVLFTFRWRALNEPSRNTDNQTDKCSPLAYTKIAMFGIVHYFHNAIKMLLSLDKDVEQLRNIVDELEKMSADTEEFLGLVELDASIEKDKAPTKRGKNPVISNSSVHLQQEEHQPSNRKRSIH